MCRRYLAPGCGLLGLGAGLLIGALMNTCVLPVLLGLGAIAAGALLIRGA